MTSYWTAPSRLLWLVAEPAAQAAPLAAVEAIGHCLTMLRLTPMLFILVLTGCFEYKTSTVDSASATPDLGVGVRTLDAVLAETGFPTPDLIKLDVQGGKNGQV